MLLIFIAGWKWIWHGLLQNSGGTAFEWAGKSFTCCYAVIAEHYYKNECKMEVKVTFPKPVSRKKLRILQLGRRRRFINDIFFCI